jgi:hypothetical protein
LIAVCAVFAATIARPASSAEHSRAVLLRLIPTSRPMVTMSDRAGSIDNFVDTSAGLLIEGWVVTTVDEIDLVVAHPGDVEVQRAELTVRPDVGSLVASRFSGFRAVFPGLAASSVRCVQFVGEYGAVAATLPGLTCRAD